MIINGSVDGSALGPLALLPADLIAQEDLRRVVYGFMVCVSV